MRIRTIIPAGVAGIVGTIFLLIPAAAHASEPTHESVTIRVTSPMYVMSIDHDIAQAHGYEVRTTADGREYVVPVGAPANAEPDTIVIDASALANAEPDTILPGNCGWSFIEFEAYGNKKESILTGFAVDDAAVGYAWHVQIHDNIGDSFRDWSGGLFFRYTWQAASDFQSGTTGFAFAFVTTASHANLWNGGVCYSVGPLDDTWLYI